MTVRCTAGNCPAHVFQPTPPRSPPGVPDPQRQQPQAAMVQGQPPHNPHSDSPRPPPPPSLAIPLPSLSLVGHLRLAFGIQWLHLRNFTAAFGRFLAIRPYSHFVQHFAAPVCATACVTYVMQGAKCVQATLKMISVGRLLQDSTEQAQ